MQGRGRARPFPAPLSDDYWQNVQDLFTRDVSTRAFRDLFAYDAQDAFRYFTREVDLDGIWPRPWYQAYPMAAWKIFLAIAFRLSPARRIMFALAVPLLILGWVRFLLASIAGGGWEVPTIFTFALVAATLMFALLMIELRDKLALKGDLEIARQIQFGLLPFEPFHREGTSIYAAMRPANTVGGDYFDIIELGERHVALAMGDVAGRGSRALITLLQGACARSQRRVRGMMPHPERTPARNIPSNRLITLFYAEYDPFTARSATSTAATTRLRAPPGASSGCSGRVSSSDAVYDVLETTLVPGDRLFLYTDGITEAFDGRDDEYGEERLETRLTAQRALAPPDLIESVREDVLAFCGNIRPRDDMTMMLVAR